MNTNKRSCIGSSLDDFLEEEEILEDCEAVAIKRVIAWQARKFMETQKISKVEFAKRLHSSRTLVDNILDENNTSITLKTMLKLSRVIGKTIVPPFLDSETVGSREHA